nr:hypothetical protein [Sphingomonas sp.]
MTRDELAALASRALATGEEEAALPRLAAAATAHRDARLYQWTALLHRSLDQHGEAITAFDAAARLAPQDPLIAHGLARTLMEAGRDARPAYDRARALAPAPADGDLLVGQSAARLAQGEGERAAAALCDILAANPLWIPGHLHLAQLQALLGHPDRAAASIDRALAAHPAEPSLWTALFDLAIRREAYFELAELIRRAPLAPTETAPFAAIAAAESGRLDDATYLFATLPPTDLPIWRIRHALRTGDVTRAFALIDAELARPAAADAGPYAFLAWRLAMDSRFDSLVNDTVQIIDLADRRPPTASRSTRSPRRCVRSMSSADNISTNPCPAGRRPTAPCSAASSPSFAPRARPSSTRSSNIAPRSPRRAPATLCSARPATAVSVSPEAGRCAYSAAATTPLTSTPTAGSVRRSTLRFRTSFRAPTVGSNLVRRRPISASTCRQHNWLSRAHAALSCSRRGCGTAPARSARASGSRSRSTLRRRASCHLTRDCRSMSRLRSRRGWRRG